MQIFNFRVHDVQVQEVTDKAMLSGDAHIDIALRVTV